MLAPCFLPACKVQGVLKQSTVFASGRRCSCSDETDLLRPDLTQAALRIQQDG